jgi:hypothetical protein
MRGAWSDFNLRTEIDFSGKAMASLEIRFGEFSSDKTDADLLVAIVALRRFAPRAAAQHLFDPRRGREVFRPCTGRGCRSATTATLPKTDTDIPGLAV